METFGIASVAAISLICYAIGMIIKSTEAIDNKYIPAIVLVVGAILGAIGMKIIPDYPATDIITQLLIKQLNSYNNLILAWALAHAIF